MAFVNAIWLGGSFLYDLYYIRKSVEMDSPISIRNFSFQLFL